MENKVKESRQMEIKRKLLEKGVKSEEQYNNQELLEKLLAYQNALAINVFEKLHAEHLEAKDVLEHFKCMAQKYELGETEEFFRFEQNMRELQNTIRALINGKKGEREAVEALKLISLENDVEILSNIEIQDGESRTEYDNIVISPNGIFVIEVKNYRNPMKLTAEGNFVRRDGYQSGQKYNLGVKMNKKEYLLRKLLTEKLAEKKLDIPVNYEGVLLYANNESDLVDEYHKIPICYCSTISQYIREKSSEKEKLTTAQIQELKRIIEGLHTPMKYTCGFDCEEITNDFAYLMSAIEEAADASTQAVSNDENPIDEACEEKVTGFSWRKVAKCAVAVAGSAAVVALGIIAQSRRE